MQVVKAKVFRLRIKHERPDNDTKLERQPHEHKMKLKVCLYASSEMSIYQLTDLVETLLNRKYRKSVLSPETIGFDPSIENLAVSIFQDLTNQTHYIEKIVLYESETFYYKVTH